jgi:hypothetical protein
MELILFYPSDPAIVFDRPCNKGIEAVPFLLREFERRGASIHRIDPSTLSFEERFREYSKATIPAIHKKYEVKRMFGTNRHSACFFGLQVPALLAKKTADDVGDTYPHRESPNTLVTIYDFLTGALAAHEPPV